MYQNSTPFLTQQQIIPFERNFEPQNSFNSTHVQNIRPKPPSKEERTVIKSGESKSVNTSQKKILPDVQIKK